VQSNGCGELRNLPTSRVIARIVIHERRPTAAQDDPSVDQDSVHAAAAASE
jgi:hypothetical protein